MAFTTMAILLMVLSLTSHVRNVDYYVCGIIGLFYLLIIISYPNFFLRYLLVFIQFTRNLLGVFIIEHSDMWLIELRTYAHPANSFGLLGFTLFLFIYVLWCINVFISPKEKQAADLFTFEIGTRRIKGWQIFLVFYIVIIILLLMKVLPHPAFVDGIDRFLYKRQYFNPFWWKLFNIINFFAPVIIAIFFRFKSKLVLSLIILYCIFLFATGEKFGGFLNMLLAVCSIYSLYGQKLPVRQIRKKLIAVILMIFVLVSIIFVHRLVTYNTNSISEFSSYFIQRITMDGQLWWKVYDIDAKNDFHIDELNDETSTYFTIDNVVEEKRDYGIFKIMKITTPMDVVNEKIGAASRYSWSTLASVFYYFKEPGLILFCIVVPIFYTFLMWSFLYAVEHLLIVELLLSSKLLLTFHGVLIQSDFNALFSFKSVIYLTLLIVLLSLRRKNIVPVRFKIN